MIYLSARFFALRFFNGRSCPLGRLCFLIKLNFLILIHRKAVGSLKCLYLCTRYYELVA